MATFLATPLGTALARVASLALDDRQLAEARRTFWTSRVDRARLMIQRGIDRGEPRATAIRPWRWRPWPRR
ncbi:TetR/AcrR family transcriptional regulator C-terminal ligand-binding domain-containing protein [Amycolatopsis anabasis]|uniref:TetR/AcrR family transcriptional regulator C-terminal ligand-binding domain-containing protein n=1 Tax=Amycolatopsis anabasis TaxID=1840409 RepID=UPI003CCD3937